MMQLKNHYHSLDARMTGLLRTLCAEPASHAKFLNTLSLLEHIGSRKIMLSQSGNGMSEEVLRHLAEETRHAFFFRRAAERVGNRPMKYSDEDLIAAAGAKMYFERLDASITVRLGESGSALSYYYMTMAVELRAEWLYNLYEEILQQGGIKFSLKSVIAEEDTHLAEMKNALSLLDNNYSERLEQFVEIEVALFGRWFDKVCEEVQTVLLSH